LAHLEKAGRRIHWRPQASTEWALRELAKRQYIPESRELIEDIIYKCGKAGFGLTHASRIALSSLRQFGASPGITAVICRGLGRADSRKIILSADINWEKIWAAKLPAALAKEIVLAFDDEIDNHPDSSSADYDLAYLTDPVSRIAAKNLLDELSQEIAEQAESSLARAGEIYSSISEYIPEDGMPDVREIVIEIDAYVQEHSAKDEEEDFS
jgi:hypothetical protein